MVLRRLYFVNSSPNHSRMTDWLFSKVGKFFGALLSTRNPQLLLLIVVKVRSVSRSLRFWCERSFHLLLVNCNPICGREPPVVLDVVDSVLQVTISFGEVDLKEVPKKFFQFGTKMWRESHFAWDNFFVNLDGLIGKEGRITGCHFVDQHSQCPPIDGFVVAFTQDDFRCEVLWRSTQSPCPAFDSFCKTKVRHLNITLLVDEEVLRFEVAIDEI